jgi:hypothetical protein
MQGPEDGESHQHNGLEPLAEVQRALLVVLVLHAPHPEAGGLLLSKLGKHCKSGKEVRRSMTVEIAASLCGWVKVQKCISTGQCNFCEIREGKRKLTGG